MAPTYFFNVIFILVYSVHMSYQNRLFSKMPSRWVSTFPSSNQSFFLTSINWYIILNSAPIFPAVSFLQSLCTLLLALFLFMGLYSRVYTDMVIIYNCHPLYITQCLLNLVPDFIQPLAYHLEDLRKQCNLSIDTTWLTDLVT